MRQYEKSGLKRDPMGKKHRIVLDTNVLISASFRKLSPVPNRIYQALKSQQFILVTSPKILEEIEDVISREKIVQRTGMTTKEQKEFIEKLTELGLVIPGETNIQVIKDDPDDDKFLIAALEGSAEYIVSGDKHLLNLKDYQGIKILSPKEFWKILS